MEDPVWNVHTYNSSQLVTPYLPPSSHFHYEYKDITSCYQTQLYIDTNRNFIFTKYNKALTFPNLMLIWKFLQWFILTFDGTELWYVEIVTTIETFYFSFNQSMCGFSFFITIGNYIFFVNLISNKFSTYSRTSTTIDNFQPPCASNLICRLPYSPKEWLMTNENNPSTPV